MFSAGVAPLGNEKEIDQENLEANIDFEHNLPDIESETDSKKVAPERVFGGWDVLDPLLKQLILENNELPRKERQPIINLLKEFALAHHKSLRSVQARYYQVIKKELDKEKRAEEIEDIENRTVETVQMLPCNYPKVGDIVNARVVNLIDYGVFMETDTGYTGFLRMGDVTSDEWLSGRNDLERYFYQGEKVKVKVIKVVDDKIYFSTKAIGGKKPHRLEQPNIIGLKIAKGSPVEAELNELVRLLTSRVGPVSEACKSVLSELLLTYGPVRVTARILEGLAEFDQGFWLARQAKDYLDGEFNRLN
ncbi:MAG: S1 RNA-binding domain-containing protein [Bacillota bacterium]|jgi:predicted RNA-binding protein with RPS1 domain